jgi:hypothetical protein
MPQHPHERAELCNVPARCNGEPAREDKHLTAAEDGVAVVSPAGENAVRGAMADDNAQSVLLTPIGCPDSNARAATRLR